MINFILLFSLCSFSHTDRAQKRNSERILLSVPSSTFSVSLTPLSTFSYINKHSESLPGFFRVHFAGRS